MSYFSNFPQISRTASLSVLPRLHDFKCACIVTSASPVAAVGGTMVFPRMAAQRALWIRRSHEFRHTVCFFFYPAKVVKWPLTSLLLRPSLQQQRARWLELRIAAQRALSLHTCAVRELSPMEAVLSETPGGTAFARMHSIARTAVLGKVLHSGISAYSRAQTTKFIALFWET